MMAQGTPQAPRQPSRAERHGSRYGALTVGIVAVAFVAASVVQIVTPLFNLGPAPQGPPDDCATPVRELSVALDRATAIASAEPTEDAAAQAFDKSLSTGWATLPDAQRICAATPDGALAMGALLRLRHAQQSLLRHRAGRLAPLREGLARRLGAR